MTMNIKFHNIPTRFLWASLVSVLVLTAGCEKDDTDGPKPPAASGKVAFLNAAFGSDSVNLFVDTKKANSKLLGYGDSLTYVDVTAGDRTFELNEKDGESVVKKTFDIEKDK